jgi:EAL domain-containing protein (putative c-di-GMP-specific phosphodiesterase class I)/GGDEF domain-containing protein
MEAPSLLREVIERRRLATLFQPIYSFDDARVLGFEALVRGPEGSGVEAPFELFAAAEREGRLIELNIVCIQEVLRAFACRRLPGALFLNISPTLIVQRGFDQARAARFLDSLGVEASRVVIELTEDASFDFRLVRESLMLYRAMGFRVAIDDLGEGFSSLRLWSELEPEFVKADKHFVTGIARDATKLGFLRAIQQIAEASGARVIAEGIENGDDFQLVRDLRIACGQGWFIGRPEPRPALNVAAARASEDARVRVSPLARVRPGAEPRAGDFLQAVDAVPAQATVSEVGERFAAMPTCEAIPVMGDTGVEGVLSRRVIEALASSGAGLDRSCARHACASPLRADAELDLAALASLLAGADAARLADGFVILSHGRYLGMGRTRDVIRALHAAQVLAARHTHPLSMLPGIIPMQEHLDKLLARRVPFTAWVAEIDELAGLNDACGFPAGDALIESTARLLEAACDPAIDLAGQASGTRFVVLAQSDDWEVRAHRVVEAFRRLVRSSVPADVHERGYFTGDSREGCRVRPLPRLALGVLPVLPGLFETRHEVLACARAASRQAGSGAGSALHVDAQRANAYPRSYLLGAR